MPPLRKPIDTCHPRIQPLPLTREYVRLRLVFTPLRGIQGQRATYHCHCYQFSHVTDTPIRKAVRDPRVLK
jgi:hypothetical protein